MEEKEIRINKYLSEAGFCSRREGDKLVAEGVVTIDGEVAEMGAKVKPGQKVLVRGTSVVLEEEEVFLLFNKPRGIVCTAEKREKDNVVDYINYPIRIYPVGRLDKDSHGLLLLTNQGDLTNEILKASNYHEKEYVVRVNKPITGQFMMHMQSGVYLSELEKKTAPCKVKKIDDKTFSIILTQGLNRQIRRMCRELDYHVRDLKRIRIMDFTLEGIGEGKYRTLSREEIQKLKNQLL
ncbi:MAG: pseudouridine synthase [Lachnospiraceae bacterium]|nr:pseudouridine synthase [Lachnospiraceae bacterium]